MTKEDKLKQTAVCDCGYEMSVYRIKNEHV